MVRRPPRRWLPEQGGAVGAEGAVERAVEGAPAWPGPDQCRGRRRHAADVQGVVEEENGRSPVDVAAGMVGLDVEANGDVARAGEGGQGQGIRAGQFHHDEVVVPGGDLRPAGHVDLPGAVGGDGGKEVAAAADVIEAIAAAAAAAGLMSRCPAAVWRHTTPS